MHLIDACVLLCTWFLLFCSLCLCAGAMLVVGVLSVLSDHSL